MILRNVQALRAVAALLVVFVHLTVYEARYLPGVSFIPPPLSNFGHFGVDLFFVISGFIMTTTTWEQFGRPGSSLAFVLRRAIRIYPPYWLALLPVFFVYLRHPEMVNTHVAEHPDFAASFLLLPGTQLLLVAWTLVFEVYFYAIFALALTMPRRRALGALAMWAVSIAVVALIAGRTVLPTFTDPLVLEFALGIAVAALTKMRPVHPLAMIGVGAAGLLFVAGLLAHGIGDMESSWYRLTAAGLPWAFVVYGTVVLERQRSIRFPQALEALGDASYALYLWHIPVLAALGVVVRRVPHTGFLLHGIVLAGMLAVTIAWALLVYRFAEAPMTKALNARLRRMRPSRVAVPTLSKSRG